MAISGDAKEVPSTDQGPRTPDEYAERLLARFSSTERAAAYRREDELTALDDESSGDPEGRATGALWFALDKLLTDRAILAAVLEQALRNLPDGQGWRAIEAAREHLRKRNGDEFSEFTALISAGSTVNQQHADREARAYFAGLLPEERAAWIQLARQQYAGCDLDFGDEFYVPEAINLAREEQAF